jgi:class 3 adenylate cyclase
MRDKPTIAVEESDLAKAEQFRRSRNTAMLAIMFVDMVQSTLRRNEVGEVRFEHARMDTDRLIREILSREGCVIKGTGDGLLAVFAEPDASVVSALNIQRMLLEQSGISLRIGVDLGQVSQEVSGISRDVFGHHVNRAARIEGLSGPGHILVSTTIWDTAHLWLKHYLHIGWYNHGRYYLKGISDPQTIFEPYDKTQTEPLKALNGTKETENVSRGLHTPLNLTDVCDSSSLGPNLDALRKQQDRARRLVQQKRWAEVAPMVFEMLPHPEFAYPVFYGAHAIEALLATDHSPKDIRDRAHISLSEMVLAGEHLYYLLDPLERTGIIDRKESLDWYRRAVESHPDSNENRGELVACLISQRNPGEAVDQIRRGCNIEPQFFKYAGESFYEFMRKQDLASDAETFMEAAESA